MKHNKQARKEHLFDDGQEARFLAAVQLLWACGTTACAVTIASDDLLSDPGRLESRICCGVVPATGFESMRVDPARMKTLRLNHLATSPAEESASNSGNRCSLGTRISSYEDLASNATLIKQNLIQTLGL